MNPEVWYDERNRCYWVPMAAELFENEEELERGVEPVRLQLRDGQLWITRLETGDGGTA